MKQKYGFDFFETIFKAAYFSHILHIRKPGGLTPGKHEIGYMQATLDAYGYNAHDDEWVANPPKPGTGGGGKTHHIVKFNLDLQEYGGTEL